MAAKSMRRLAADHAHLYRHGLPPNYLFPPNQAQSSDLSVLSVLVAGPDDTPFAAGVYHLELRMEAGIYPTSPPTASFRTKIFHPNVDPSTGAICVDTLKRDWKPELTLRDVLVTITCLLVCPNPASALNPEAGRLMEEDFGYYEQRAIMWSSMFATVPAALHQAVAEAKTRVTLEPNTQSSFASKGRKMKQDHHALPLKDYSIQSQSGNTPGSQKRLSSIDLCSSQDSIVIATSAASPRLQTTGGLCLFRAHHRKDSTTATVQPACPLPRPIRKHYAILPPQLQQKLQLTSIDMLVSSPMTQHHSSTTPTRPPLTRAHMSSSNSLPSSSSIPPTSPTHECPSKRRRTNSLSPPLVSSRGDSCHSTGNSSIMNTSATTKNVPRLRNPAASVLLRSPRTDPFHPSFTISSLDWRIHLPLSPSSAAVSSPSSSPSLSIRERRQIPCSRLDSRGQQATVRRGIFRL